MRRTTFRDHLACGVLAAGVLVAGAVLTPDQAWSGEGVRGDRLETQTDVAHKPIQARRGQTRTLRMPCTVRHRAVEALNNDFGETQTGYGLVGPDGIIEVFTSAEGTWTVLASNADGTTCIVAAGKHWQNVEQEIPGTDS